MLTVLAACLLLGSYQNVDTHKINPYTSKYTVTAYAKCEPGVTGITYLGRQARYGTIAVDPRYIPFGSKIYVPGYGFGWASDIGGLIKGRHIDLYVASRHEANRFGRQKLEILIYPPSNNIWSKQTSYYIRHHKNHHRKHVTKHHSKSRH